MIQLYDTATRTIQTLPMDHRILLYTCGPTVYLEPHIGNWKTFIFYDTLYRSLQFLGYKVNHVINITDVGHLSSDADEGDDKIQHQAEIEHRSAWDISRLYSQKYEEGRKILNLCQPTKTIKATDTIEQQIQLVGELIEKGVTYTTDEGIYFDICKFPDYGKMARLDLTHLRTTGRVLMNGKRNEADFALWKFSPKGKKRDMEWDSPWGKGFPGWHLECSAIARTFLGPTLDIHAGGIDHIPIHHTNEIAQSETANGLPLSRIWMHSEFMKINSSKMSKSLGNYITLNDITKKGYNPLSFKLMVLQGHYRTATNFSWDNLESSQKRLLDLYNFASLRWQLPQGNDTRLIDESMATIKKIVAHDLATPDLFAHLSSIIDDFYKTIHSPARESFNTYLQQLDELLGLKLIDNSPDISESVKSLIQKRQQCRIKKDYRTGDEIRQQLTKLNLTVLDTPQGPLWQRISLNYFD